MKKLLFGLLTFFIALNTFALPKLEVYLGSLTVYKLNNVKQSAITLYTYRPGLTDCSILIRSNTANDLKSLEDRFYVSVNFPASDMSPYLIPGSLVYKLQDRVVYATVILKSKDGRSIAENIAELYPPTDNDSHDIAALSGICHGDEPHI